MVNKIKKLLKEGKPAFGAQLRLGSPAIAEMFSLAGFDWLVIDSEHAPQTPVGIQTQLQAIAAGGATPIVRLQKNDPDTIRLYLDMGAHGVLVPFINTAADAEAGVKACLYPPRGIRGFGPSRGSKYGMDPTYFDRADDEIISSRSSNPPRRCETSIRFMRWTASRPAWSARSISASRWA